MNKYEIPVTFEMYGRYVIEANSLKEAIDIILNSVTGLPQEKEYIDDSLKIDYDGIDIKENEDGPPY